MFKKLILTLFLQCVLSISYATEFDQIIAFGDSLTDTGNIYNLSVQARKVIPIFPLIPRDPPYYHGRFSNGPIWIEKLAEEMNIPVTSYAYGGSWAETILDSGPFVPFSLGTQIDYYLVTSVTDFHKDKHLYVIWSGANDYIHGRYDTDGKPDIDYPTTNTTKVIQSQIDWLIFYGAKNFLILNLPDLSFTPQIMAKNSEFVRMASDLSQQHNIKLGKMLAEEKKRHADVKIVTIDIGEYFNDLIINPYKYNLKNIKDACYGGGYLLNKLRLAEEPEVKAAKEMKLDILNNDVLFLAYENSLLAQQGKKACSNDEEYLFWDKIHPTQAIHQGIAKIALQEINKEFNNNSI